MRLKIYIVNNINFLNVIYKMNNNVYSVADDNINLNIKMFILDPLSVIVKLAILSNKPVGTKLLIQNNVIYFQEPGPFQALCRIIYKSNKTDLQFMYNPINVACLNFLSKSFIEKTPRIKNLFVCAQNGLKKLIETYKTCSIITLTLNYYYAILTNHINQIYNENMFIKDNFTCYYNTEVCERMNKQWSDEKIKVILDIISFLLKHNDNPNNVKSLETIIDSIDTNTHILINDIF
jgi:hypothetical protein